MEGADEQATAKRSRRRGNSIVVRAGGGAGGLLLGGALAATAAVAVAFIARAAARRNKQRAQGSPTGAEQEDRASGDADSSEEGVGEGLLSLPLSSPPSPPPLPPSPATRILHRHDFAAATPPPSEEEGEFLVVKAEGDSNSGHQIYQNPDAILLTGTDDSCATVHRDVLVEESNPVQAPEKIIEESISIEAGQEEEEQDSLPAVINKDVVVEESRSIQVVRDVQEDVFTPKDDGSAAQDRDGPAATVEEGTKETVDETGNATDAVEVVSTAKAVEHSLPSLRIRHRKLMAVALEEVFHGGEGKLGVEEAELLAKQKREGVVVAGTEPLTTKAVFSKSTAQVFVLVSAFFFMGVLSAWIHYYSKRLLESSHL